MASLLAEMKWPSLLNFNKTENKACIFHFFLDFHRKWLEYDPVRFQANDAGQFLSIRGAGDENFFS